MREWSDLKTAPKKTRRAYYSVKKFWRLRIVGTFEHMYYWLRCHTFNKYHIINAGKYDFTDNYKWGWLDRDHLMLLACFGILCEFVDKEDPKCGLDTTIDRFLPSWETMETWNEAEQNMIKDQLSGEKEIRDLYNWWKFERPLEHKAHHKKYTYQREEELTKKDNEMLLRLMAIRQRLWT